MAMLYISAYTLNRISLFGKQRIIIELKLPRSILRKLHQIITYLFEGIISPDSICLRMVWLNRPRKEHGI
jgi:hypothetical protein